jgi:hypothetical protein
MPPVARAGPRWSVRGSTARPSPSPALARGWSGACMCRCWALLAVPHLSFPPQTRESGTAPFALVLSPPWLSPPRACRQGHSARFFGSGEAGVSGCFARRGEESALGIPLSTAHAPTVSRPVIATRCGTTPPFGTPRQALRGQGGRASASVKESVLATLTRRWQKWQYWWWGSAFTLSWQTETGVDPPDDQESRA